MAREQVKLKKAGPAAPLARGALLIEGRVSQDAWALLGDEDEILAGADVVVSLARFKAERETLLARNSGRLGVSIAPADAVEDIAEDVARFATVFVQFPGFRDGRGYSSARLLRERFGYTGELRAIGDVLEDQIFYMLRCGFDAFELRGEHAEAIFARASKTFSVAYQSSADAQAPAHVLRAQLRARGKASE